MQLFHPSTLLARGSLTNQSGKQLPLSWLTEFLFLPVEINQWKPHHQLSRALHHSLFKLKVLFLKPLSTFSGIVPKLVVVGQSQTCLFLVLSERYGGVKTLAEVQHLYEIFVATCSCEKTGTPS